MLHVAEFPVGSVTVQVTFVVPNGKTAGALFVTLSTEQLSAVTGIPSATVLDVQSPISTVLETSPGQVIVGKV